MYLRWRERRREPNKWRVAYTKRTEEEKGITLSAPIVTNIHPCDPGSEARDGWLYLSGEYETKAEAEAALARAPIEQTWLFNRSCWECYKWPDGKVTFSTPVKTEFNRVSGMWEYPANCYIP